MARSPQRTMRSLGSAPVKAPHPNPPPATVCRTTLDETRASISRQIKPYSLRREPTELPCPASPPSFRGLTRSPRRHRTYQNLLRTVCSRGGRTQSWPGVRLVRIHSWTAGGTSDRAEALATDPDPIARLAAAMLPLRSFSALLQPSASVSNL